MDDTETYFPLRSFCHLGGHIAVLSENAKGPCLFVAIVNCLVLQKRLDLTSLLPNDHGCVEIPSSKILGLITVALNIDAIDKRTTKYKQLKILIELLPFLTSSQDIDPILGDIFSFRCSEEIKRLFIALDIKLLHACTMDRVENPKIEEYLKSSASLGDFHNFVDNASYKQLVLRHKEYNERSGNFLDVDSALDVETLLSMTSTEVDTLRKGKFM